MIGDVLKAVRIANYMTLREASEKANVSVSYLADLEKNWHNPSNRELEKICLAYNLDVPELLKLDKYHETIIKKIGLKEELLINRLLLREILNLYVAKEQQKTKVNTLSKYNKL